MNVVALILSLASVSQTLDLPPGLLSAVCYVESGHSPEAYNPNDNGSPSIGPCQIKIATARLMGFEGKTKDFSVMQTNTYWAGVYLKHQLTRYNGDATKAIAAYNAGTHRVNAKGQIKNRKYVDKVLLAWRKNR